MLIAVVLAILASGMTFIVMDSLGTSPAASRAAATGVAAALGCIVAAIEAHSGRKP